MSLTNGNGTGVGSGYGSSAEMRLQKLLAEHEGKVQALRLSLAMLHEQAAEKKERRQSSVMSEALELEQARITQTKRGRRPGSKNKKKQPARPSTAEDPVSFTSKMAARRLISSRLLSVFNGETPLTPAEAGLTQLETRQLGAMYRHGYLKRKKGSTGWLRTDKPFRVDLSSGAA